MPFQNEEKQMMNELFIEEVKYLDFVDKEKVENLKRICHFNDKETCALLKVNPLSYQNLMQMKSKKIKIDLLDESEKRQIEQKLIEKYQQQDYITKEEILQTKKEIPTTDALIKNILCIPTEAFRKVMNGKISKTRITLKNTKLKMNYLKMDIKYLYGEGFYTNAVIRKMCMQYQVEFDDFLKEISMNMNRYPYIKEALKENKKGIYIGEEHELSKEFAAKNALILENMCRKIVNQYCYASFLHTEKLDLVQEAFLLILQKGGNIEKNFSYNQELLFHLLASKVKYFVIGKRNKRYKEILLDSFESYSQKNEDSYEMSENHLANVFVSIDNRIQFIHHRVMQIFNDNKDYIYHHRKNAYKIIAHQLKITIEKLEKIIQEIKEIYIEHGFAKQCLDGSIIDMSRLENRNSQTKE